MIRVQITSGILAWGDSTCGNDVTLTRAGTRAENYGEGSFADCHSAAFTRAVIAQRRGRCSGSMWSARPCFTASREKYADVFPAFPLVDDDAVGRAFVRSVQVMGTGQVYEP